MIVVQKECDEMFMWKTNDCFLFFVDTLHGISYAGFMGEGGWVIVLLAV